MSIISKYLFLFTIVKVYGIQNHEMLVISYLQILYKHHKYFELNNDRLQWVLEYILNNKDIACLSHAARVRSHQVLKNLIKSMKSLPPPFIENLLETFKERIYQIVNTLPTKIEQEELKESRRNIPPHSVDKFEVFSVLLMISNIPNSKKIETLNVSFCKYLLDVNH